MNLEESKAALAVSIREHRYSRRTLENYTGWLDRFWRWRLEMRDAGRTFESREERLTAYLSNLAPRVAWSTQRQALCALIFYHREVAKHEIGKLPEWVSAKRPTRLPEWVTAAEAVALFERMRGTALMLAELQFGSGLRLREVVGLRIKDLRFEERTLVVRGGKGDKDRTALLPESLIPRLREFVERSRMLWEDDVRDGVPGVCLPDDVRRKCPNHGSRWEWQWVFPSGKLSTDPETGIVRRHHVHPDMLNKAITAACAKCRLGRRVTSHALRHGFATALLMAGRPLQEVSKLLGHSSIETTARYLHCLPRLEERTVSPLDAARNIIPIRQAS